MKTFRLDWMYAGLLALVMCGPVSAGAGEATPVSPVVISGKGNSVKVYYPTVSGVTVKLKAGSELAVTGEEEAVFLGHDATVALEERSTLSLSTDYEGKAPVRAISIDGDEKASTNSVTLSKGAVISVSTTKAKETSAIDIFDTDNAHVALDGARVKVSAEGGEVSGVKLEKVAMPDTASLTLSNGAGIDVSGGAAFGIEKGGDPEGEANGALISQATHGEVRLSGGSDITVSTSSSLKDADAGSDGVEITRTEAAEVALSGMSSINAQALSSGLSGSAYISGVDADHIKTLSISLDDASKICGTGTASLEKGHAGVSGIEIDEVQDIEVGLAGQAQLRAVATGQEAVATAFHSVSSGWEGSEDPIHATVVLAEGAMVVGEAAGAYSQAGGVIMEDSDFGVVRGNGGSRITANAAGAQVRTSSKEDEGIRCAAATVVGMRGVKNAAVAFSNTTLVGNMTAEVHRTDAGNTRAIIGPGDRGILPVGIGVVGYTQADIRLRDTQVVLTAEATASAANGESMAVVGDIEHMGVPVSGVLVMAEEEKKFMRADGKLSATTKLVEKQTAIHLTRSSIDVTARASAEKSLALASGITLKGLAGESEGDPATLVLTDSGVNVVAEAQGPRTRDMGLEKPSAVALGVATDDLAGKTSVILDNSIITANAAGDMVSALGIAAMDGGEGHGLDVTLSRGSQIKAEVSRGIGGFADDAPRSAAIALASGSIAVDETSSLQGEWAVFRQEATEELRDGTPRRAAPLLALNNKGLVKGRLSGVALDNASTGILQADFNATGDFSYASSGADNTFYFQTDSAKLTNGTTFRIVPNEGLGLSRPGQTQTYALLESGAPIQGTKAALNLEAKGNSPLLGLSWVDTSKDTELVAQIRFLSPSEAGVSRNGSAAFTAALADMPTAFVLGTDPEGWAPSVSGAFLSGMTQTVGASHTNIGNRLGGLMGLNSGDEIVASGGLWYNASFTDADQDERGGVVGFDADTTGFSLGLDRQQGDLTVGVALTQGKSEAVADDNSSEMDMDDYLVSFYGSYDAGRWFGEAVLSAGVGNVDSVRRLDDTTFTADYDSTSYNAMAKAGMTLNAVGFQINPLLTMEYSFKEYDSYIESGGKDSGALEVASQDYTVFNVGGGAIVQRSWVKPWGVLTPEISAMVRYDLKSDGILTTAKFVGGSTAFIARGADPAETSWDISTALTLASLEESAVSLRLGYDYAGRDDFAAHSVSGKVRFEF
ncbi:autotransporter outer membrane beta-barrel domain-containing protein [Desulfoluna butyratoxydans]|uniref:Autotransporter beta-domain n=1 Tax=Desulfoluna butyratoxydans TaxID=231438 RepID=A0A4U8YLN3_9BACT|nr:autotransporter outer membrane beta-barrel domain-containing protein [Desulfoluna butyratoxydans]VFQ44487.1 autotransporter beta-domain [Desulfoluna butyratoxydans]